MTYRDADLDSFRDEERVLAKEIAMKTGVAPAVVMAFDKGTKHRGAETYKALRFWMRDRDGMIISRDLDLRDYHHREGVKHALRAVVRTTRLDHVGLPIEASTLAIVETLVQVADDRTARGETHELDQALTDRESGLATEVVRLTAEVERLREELAGYHGKPCGRRDCADVRAAVERLTRERERKT
jgi:hypothetical protein